MKDFDYETYYESRSDTQSELVKKIGLMKASRLYEFIEGEKNTQKIIGEVGSGPGDVLNFFKDFKTKIAMDISLEGLQLQVNKYFKKKIDLNKGKFDFENYYSKRISRKDILGNFKSCRIPIDDNLVLLKIKHNEPLPFENKSIDCLVLCDVVEHVSEPVEFLKDMSRVGKKLLIKIPIEKALLIKLFYRLGGIKYGENHPAGHLRCWNTEEVFNLLKLSGIRISKWNYLPNDFEYSEKKSFFKLILLKSINFLDRIFSTDYLFSKLLSGGNLLVYGEEKQKR